MRGWTGNLAASLYARFVSGLYMSGDELEALSHSERSWRESYNGQTGIASNVIPNDLIKAYYSDLMCGDSRIAERHHVPRFPVSPKIVVSDDDFAWLESIL